MRPAALTSIIALAVMPGAAASANTMSGRAQAEVRIVDSGGVQVVSPLILPTVTTTISGAGFAGDVTYAGTGGTVYARNARLTIRRQAGEALTVGVPATFTVVRNGGSEALTVRTSTSGEYGVMGDGILLSGAYMNGVVTNVDIGGQLALASSDRLVPGPYEGLLVVVVEYN